MKKIMQLAVLAGLVLAAFSNVQAKIRDFNSNEEQIESRVKQIDKKLKLTTDQKNLIRALLTQERKRINEVNNQLALIRQQALKEIKSLLTDEQRLKYEKIEKKMRIESDKELE